MDAVHLGRRASACSSGLAATIIAVALGAGFGIVAGYAGGRTEAVLMRITEFFLVIPFIPFAVVLASVLHRSLTNIIFVIGITSWPGTARLIRAQVLSVKTRLYVDRSRALGAGHWHVISRHILPNVMPLIFANLTLTVPIAILSESTLSFLGLGDPLRISWGVVLQNAFDNSAVTLGRVVVSRSRSRHHLRRARVHDVRARARRDPRSATRGRRVSDDGAPRGPRSATSRTGRARAMCPSCAASRSSCSAAGTLGLAGESGCGKTTIANAVLRLLPPGPASKARCCSKAKTSTR